MTVASLALGSPSLAQISMSRGLSAESELIRRAKRGDLTAFEELFRLNQGRIYALCLRMVADPGRAEDLTQDAFVRAWQKLGSFRAHSAFGTWLHRLTINVVLGDLRSRKRWESRTSDLESTEPTLSARPRRDSVAAVDLEQAIAALPTQARSVFVLHDVEGYKHREIADMIGLAEGTCKAHLHRARQLLRKRLRR
jgi:RNA polymerase sigma-70 factor (ECF subfamily)